MGLPSPSFICFDIGTQRRDRPAPLTRVTGSLHIAVNKKNYLKRKGKLEREIRNIKNKANLGVVDIRQINDLECELKHLEQYYKAIEIIDNYKEV